MEELAVHFDRPADLFKISVAPEVVPKSYHNISQRTIFLKNRATPFVFFSLCPQVERNFHFYSKDDFNGLLTIYFLTDMSFLTLI